LYLSDIKLDISRKETIKKTKEQDLPGTGWGEGSRVEK
jgi:hypothetical protein